MIIANFKAYFLKKNTVLILFYHLFYFKMDYIFFWTLFINNFFWKTFCICSILLKFYIFSISSIVN